MKVIAITGVNGFLGRNLAHLLKDSYKIVGIVREIPKVNNFGFPIDFVKSDFSSINALLKSTEIFSIIHTATVYRPKNYTFELIDSNVKLPLMLLELSNKHNVKCFINTDTFFNSSKGKSYSYLNNYTHSKKNCIDWLSSIQGYCKLFNIKIFHMYGKGDSSSKFVTMICESLLANKEKIDLTPGLQKRDFVYIDDVIQSYKCVLDNFDIIKTRTEFEVGVGKSITVKQFVERAKKISSSKSILNFGSLPYRENEIMDATARIEPLLTLGWKPQFSIDAGLEKLLK